MVSARSHTDDGECVSRLNVPYQSAIARFCIALAVPCTVYMDANAINARSAFVVCDVEPWKLNLFTVS